MIYICVIIKIHLRTCDREYIEDMYLTRKEMEDIYQMS